MSTTAAAGWAALWTIAGIVAALQEGGGVGVLTAFIGICVGLVPLAVVRRVRRWRRKRARKLRDAMATPRSSQRLSTGAEAVLRLVERADHELLARLALLDAGGCTVGA